MAEIVSKQAADIAAGTKMSAAKAYGHKRVITITSPDTAAWADGDTVASGIKLPVGTRILCDTFISHDAMGTSVVAALGLREFAGAKTVIDADGIAAAIAVATAGRSAANNGALVAAGVEYVTTVESEIYMTLSGAAATANKQIRAEVSVVTPD